MDNIYQFAKESNEIEGIFDEERHRTHAIALQSFINLEIMSVRSLIKFVGTLEPLVKYRYESRTECMIGGGRYGTPSEHVSKLMIHTLAWIKDGDWKPNKAHKEYEHIHPFEDCNGRSGRALWFWQMKRECNYSGHRKFLHEYYYQGLREYEK